MRSIHNNYAPGTLHNLWPKNTDRNIKIQLRNLNDYTLPKVNYSFFTRFPPYSFPLIWNTYEGTSKLQTSRFTFITYLKNEFLNDHIPPTVPHPPTLPSSEPTTPLPRVPTLPSPHPSQPHPFHPLCKALTKQPILFNQSLVKQSQIKSNT